MKKKHRNTNRKPADDVGPSPLPESDARSDIEVVEHAHQITSQILQCWEAPEITTYSFVIVLNLVLVH